MEDYIVVILVILSMIFGLFNKKKPKESGEDSSPLSIPDFKDTFFENDSYNQPDIQHDYYNPEPEYQPWYFYNTPITQPETKQEPATVLHVDTAPVQEKTVSKKRKPHPFLKDFSLDKAVVYSEILNRKYE